MQAIEPFQLKLIVLLRLNTNYIFHQMPENSIINRRQISSDLRQTDCFPLSLLLVKLNAEKLSHSGEISKKQIVFSSYCTFIITTQREIPSFSTLISLQNSLQWHEPTIQVKASPQLHTNLIQNESEGGKHQQALMLNNPDFLTIVDFRRQCEFPNEASCCRTQAKSDQEVLLVAQIQHTSDSYNISLIKLFRFLMSYEERQSAEIGNQEPYQELKFQNQHTTIYLKSKNTNPPVHLDFESFQQTSTDISFDSDIHEENLQHLKTACSVFLEECLQDSFNKEEGFKDEELFKSLPFDISCQNGLEGLVSENYLLTETQKQEIVEILTAEEELVGLLKHLTPSFGLTVAKEMVYVMYQILKLKYLPFRKLIEFKDTIIPKFNCFQGFQDSQSPLQTSCPVYEDINLEEIHDFAEKQLNNMSSSIYFSNKIQYINLKEIKSEIKSKVSVLVKFDTLVKQISKTVFFTLVGAIEPLTSSFHCLDLSREVSFAELPESQLSMARLASRPFVPCEQENYDFMTKKIKFDKRLE